MYQCRVPIYLQFELTHRCNHRCVFCYNELSHETTDNLSTNFVRKILASLNSSGVRSINFNGGEPLCRTDFTDIVAYATSLRFQLHVNTNATLIDDEMGRFFSKHFSSVCTSLYSSDEKCFDRLSMAPGAFQRTLKGIQTLLDNDIYVAVNIMLCRDNVTELEGILSLAKEMELKTIHLTRYIPIAGGEDRLLVDDRDFFDALRSLARFQKENRCFERISLPQPVPPYSLPWDLQPLVAEWNVPCTLGLCTARITPSGRLTPCALVSEPDLGDLTRFSLDELWSRFDGVNFCKNHHWSATCRSCRMLPRCGGGCKGYNDGIEKSPTCRFVRSSEEERMS